MNLFLMLSFLENTSSPYGHQEGDPQDFEAPLLGAPVTRLVFSVLYFSIVVPLKRTWDITNGCIFAELVWTKNI